MTKEEMLQKSGLTEREFKELVRKFQDFLASLDVAQKAAVHRWLPTASQIAASFGPALTTQQLADIVGGDPDSSTSIAERGVGLGAPSPPPPRN
jgi:hypothetical protein